MVKNKKGWMKIAEAFIAIVLLATVILTIYNSQPKKVSSSEIPSIEDSLISEIAENPVFRQDILDGKEENIKNFINLKIPGNLDFDMKICQPEDICNLDIYKKEVYAKERIISSTLQEYSPKKLKLFMWQKT